MIQSVKLSKLVPSDVNVRKRRADKAESFAASISARGILQNLIVTPLKKPRGHFGIVAGESRYRGLMLLVERGEINADDYDVPVKLMTGPESELSEVSLVENMERAPLHPLDQFRAFQAMRDKGMTEEAIAAARAVGPHAPGGRVVRHGHRDRGRGPPERRPPRGPAHGRRHSSERCRRTDRAQGSRPSR